MIHVHECMAIIGTATHRGTLMGKKDVNWMRACSNHSCACMRGCVPDSCACVCNCVANRCVGMHIYVCDKGAFVCPFIIDSCTCMRYYGMNKSAYVCTCGQNSRALEAKLRGVKTYLFWRFWCFYGL
jgi:hypothetical protein